MTRHPLVWSPPSEEAVAVVRRGPALRRAPGQPIKVMTWNVQYFAGRGYVFFYDLAAWDGPDERPSRTALAHGLDGVAAAILAEDPDVVLLQELDDGADRTGGDDQLSLLWDRLGDRWPVATSAFYWRSRFVPHPRVRGAVGLKLAILSRWDMTTARRVQLSLIPSSWLRQAFGMKRTVLLGTLPATDGSEWVAGCTHLDAFAQGTPTMARQVDEIGAQLAALDRRGADWFIGGDFNLLATRSAYERLSPEQQAGYSPQSELLPLLARYDSVPSPDAIDGPRGAEWHTYFHNDPSVPGPDRTIDYLFVSPRLRTRNTRVRQDDGVLRHSDHFPVISEIYAAGSDSGSGTGGGRG